MRLYLVEQRSRLAGMERFSKWTPEVAGPGAFWAKRDAVARRDELKLAQYNGGKVERVYEYRVTAWQKVA